MSSKKSPQNSFFFLPSSPLKVPPGSPSNVVCETSRSSRFISCSWERGQETHLPKAYNVSLKRYGAILKLSCHHAVCHKQKQTCFIIYYLEKMEARCSLIRWKMLKQSIYRDQWLTETLHFSWLSPLTTTLGPQSRIHTSSLWRTSVGSHFFCLFPKTE